MRTTSSGDFGASCQSVGPPLGAGMPSVRPLQGPGPVSTGHAYLGLPKALLTRLIDAFFDNMYNATLLLHKARFLESVDNQSVRPDVLLSVCVMASRLASPESVSRATLMPSSFEQDGSARNTLADDGFVQEWAERASGLALQDIGDFHPDSLVTFCNLALYWYSRGSWRKAFFYKASALSLLQAIGSGNDVYRDNTLLVEVRRRRLWACYLMQCQNAESLRHFDDIVDIQNLPLPWPEQYFERGGSEEGPAYLHSSPAGSSVYAELVKVMTIWSKVALVNRGLDMPMSERISFINHTQEELNRYWKSVPQTFQPPDGDLTGFLSTGQAKVMLINVAYHQTICSLHASIVPLFSGVPSDGDWSHARQSSAQIAFKHARAASDLITALLKTPTQATAYPGFLGYAAYCGIAIQMPFMWCLNEAVQREARRNVQANFALIQQVAKFWKVAAMLLKQSHTLYDGYKKAPVVLEDEPRLITMDDLRGVPIKSEETSRTILAYNGALQAKGRGVKYPEACPEAAAENPAMQGRDNVSSPAAGIQQTYAADPNSGQHRTTSSFPTPGLEEEILGGGLERDNASAQPSSQFWWDRAQYLDQQPFIINPFQGSGMDDQLPNECSMDQTLFEWDQSEVLEFFSLDESFTV